MHTSLERNLHVNPYGSSGVHPGHRALVWDIADLPAGPSRSCPPRDVRTLQRPIRTRGPVAGARTAGPRHVEQRRELGRTVLGGAVAGLVLVVGVTMGLENNSAPTGEPPETVTAYTARQ